METNTVPRGTLYEKGKALIEVAEAYWEEYQRSLSPAAVVWLKADNGSLVSFGALLFAFEATCFDELLGVVPCTASVGHEQREHCADDHGRSERASEGFCAKGEADDRGSENRDQAGQDHFSKGGTGGEVNACGCIGTDAFLAFQEAWNLAELTADFDDDLGSGVTDRLHRGSADDTGQNGADERCTFALRFQPSGKAAQRHGSADPRDPAG